MIMIEPNFLLGFLYALFVLSSLNNSLVYILKNVHNNKKKSLYNPSKFIPTFPVIEIILQNKNEAKTKQIKRVGVIEQP